MRLMLYRSYALLALVRAVVPREVLPRVETAADVVARMHATVEGDSWAIRA